MANIDTWTQKMSGIVRILAVVFAAAVMAVLYFAANIRWYLAVPAGLAVFIGFPICHEFVAKWRRRVRATSISKNAQDRNEHS